MSKSYLRKYTPSAISLALIVFSSCVAKAQYVNPVVVKQSPTLNSKKPTKESSLLDNIPPPSDIPVSPDIGEPSGRVCGGADGGESCEKLKKQRLEKDRATSKEESRTSFTLIYLLGLWWGILAAFTHFRRLPQNFR